MASNHFANMVKLLQLIGLLLLKKGFASERSLQHITPETGGILTRLVYLRCEVFGLYS